MHTLIVGGTGFGKTTYAKQLAMEAAKRGRPVGILDPMMFEGDTGWPQGAFITDDSHEFEVWAKDQLNAWLFIDEGHDSIGSTRWNTEMHWLFRFGRHFGHRVTVITQHPSDLPPLVRSQCRFVVCFNIDGTSAHRLAMDCHCAAFDEAPTLDQFEFICKQRGNFEPVRQHLETDF